MKKQDAIENIEKLLTEAIKNSIKGYKNIGLLFSGGVDSSTIAFILKKFKVDFTCYTAGVTDKNLEEAKDIVESKKVAKSLKLKHKIIEMPLSKTEPYIKKVIKVIGSSNVVKVGVGAPFFIAMEEAKKDKIDVMLNGLGSEEIFAGYDRHKRAEDINEECKKGLLDMHHRDLIRDYAIARHHGIELKMPFLEPKLVKYALSIPGNMKIKDEQNKLILRETSISMGLPEEFAMRKKMGAQYGSKFDRAILKLAKRNGFSKKSEYLDSLK